jgi:WD40 repeat protein
MGPGIRVILYGPVIPTDPIANCAGWRIAMDKSVPTTSGDNHSRPSERVDELCDRFEAAWRAGHAPRIEDYLADADETDRHALRDELVTLERELRETTQLGAQADTVAYGTAAEAATIAPGASTTPQSGAAAGARTRYFGDYEITREMARGGMGVVFEARQMSLNRRVALKMILAGQLANETEVKRFLSEAEAAANLDHPGIVPIFEIGEHDGQHYFSMGFVEGQSLALRLTVGPLPPREAAALMAKVADAIEYAHQRGVIHRDLKPANILLDAAGSPRVTDFGLAKRVQGDSGLTGSGQIMGTPSYMPPEQAGTHRGGLGIGPAADVYSLGATLYALLSGRPPFQAATSIDTVLMVLSDEPVPPRRLNASVPLDLETICLKCLQKDANKRYKSAADVAADLRRFLANEPIVARPVTGFEWAVKWVRRRPAIAALWALVAVVTALGLGGVLWQWRDAVKSRIVADRESRHAKDQAGVAEQRRLEAEDRRNEADRARRNEAAARQASDQARGALKNEKDRAIRSLYNTSIPLAHQVLQIGDVARADDLLDGCPSRLRDWEWRYLKGLCHLDVLTVKGDVKGEFTSDGRGIVSVEMSGAVKLRDAATGDVIRSTPAGEIPLAFDLKRLLVVTCSLTGRLRILSLGSNSPPRVLKSSESIAVKGALSPDGKVLALVAPGASEVRLVSLDRDAEIARLKGRADSINALAFSPDNRLLGVGRDNGWIDLWDFGTGERRLEFRGHPTRDAMIQQLTFSSDSKRVTTASVDGTARVCAVDDGRSLLVVRGHRQILMGVACSPDGRLLATAGLDRTARLWDADTGQELALFGGHGSAVVSVAFSPSGKRLLTGSADATIRLWEVPTVSGEERSTSPSASAEPVRDRPNRTITGRAAAVAALAFHPNGRRLASTDWDGLLRIDDLNTGRTTLSLPITPDAVAPGSGSMKRDVSLGAIAYSPDGRVLAVGTGGAISEIKGIAHVIDAETGRMLAKTATLNGPITALAFSPDGRRLLVATGNLRGLIGATPTVGVYDAASGAQLSLYKGHSAAVLDAAFSHDGRFAASAGLDGGLRIWNPSDGKQLQVLGGASAARSVAWSPDDSLLVGGCIDGSVRIYQTKDGKERQPLTGHSGQIYKLTFSPDGKRLASTGQDSTVRIWDAASGDELLTLRDHSNEVYALTFSPDGQILASGGLDATIRVRSAGPAIKPAATETWPVIFSDNFDRQELGDRWKIVSGHWSIESGAAVGVVEQMPGILSVFHAATIVPKNLYLPSKVEARFECWAPQAIVVEAKFHDTEVDTINGCGLLLMGMPTSLHPGRLAAAISVQKNNKWETARSNPRFTLEKDTHYQVRLLREPGRLTVFLGDDEVVNAAVPETEMPVFHLQGGFGSSGDKVYFDQVEIRAPVETAAERAALARVVELYKQELMETDVPARLRDDPKLDAPARKLALAIASRRQKRSQALNNVGYGVAADPRRTPAEFNVALRMLEEAHRLVPGSWNVLDSLGVAQLRVGRDREALESLSRAGSIIRTESSTSAPTNLAFQAIAQARLGRRTEAELLLDRVGELIADDVRQGPGGESFRIRDEAEAAITSTTASDRERTIRNLRMVVKAIQQYATDKHVLPPAAVTSVDGKPLLSWRVALLPYLGETKLFSEFHLNESWDSPHNRSLLDKMPACFKTRQSDGLGPSMTYVQAFVGPEAVFDGQDGLPVEKITDGTVSTVIAAEAAEGVPWTKPADLAFSANENVPSPAALRSGRVSLLFADGVVLTVDRDRLKSQDLRALITRAGGETIDRSSLPK